MDYDKEDLEGPGLADSTEDLSKVPAASPSDDDMLAQALLGKGDGEESVASDDSQVRTDCTIVLCISGGRLSLTLCPSICFPLPFFYIIIRQYTS